MPFPHKQHGDYTRQQQRAEQEFIRRERHHRSGGDARLLEPFHDLPVARRKLRQLEIAGCLADLRVPPGNRLEALKGARTGQWT